jgi:putative acetyltransferase
VAHQYLRAEEPDDRRAIAEVTEAAFGKRREARLVDAIRSSDRFVVELEGSSTRVLELAPMSVEPERQRTGIGSALVREALRGAEERDEPLVLALGHPRYYPRFGFRPASELGISPPDPSIPDDVSWRSPCGPTTRRFRGHVVFPPAFSLA